METYIKQHYPDINFSKPVESKDKKNALGFVISDDRLVLGYIAKNGSLKSLGNAEFDLKHLSDADFQRLVNSIAVVNTFTPEHKDAFLRLFAEKSEPITRAQLTKQIQKHAIEKRNEHDIIPSNNGDFVLVKKGLIEQIKKEYLEQQKVLEQKEAERKHLAECRDHILYEKETVIQRIQDYQRQMDTYIHQQLSKNQNLQDANQKLAQEKAQIEMTLKHLQENEQKNLEKLEAEQDLHTDFSYQLNAKMEEIETLNKTIAEIRKELNNTQEKLSESELRAKKIGMCIEHILNEKQTIIARIREYTEAWLQWARVNHVDTRNKINSELKTIYSQLETVLQNKNMYIQTLSLDSKAKSQLINQLKANISEIRSELRKSAQQQLVELNAQRERNTTSEFKIQETESENESLRMQLNDVRKLLEKQTAELNEIKNVKKAQQTAEDLDVCYNILQTFIRINNSFNQKQQIIARLDKLISENVGQFQHLTVPVRQNIQTRYLEIRKEILKHIEFLDLKRYINDPNVELFKSNSTAKRVDPQFCKDLDKINNYWMQNVSDYQYQTNELMNIYEDLSGAIRIYVKVKPLIGIEQKSDTVQIDAKQNSVTVDCSNVPNFDRDIKKQIFSNFYGIFDETYSNAEVFTGVRDTRTGADFRVYTDTENYGSLQNVFKQTENGYSVVLFGYGTSGSGKSRTLLGEPNVPGLIHYIIANLTGVSSIRVKNIFEQGIDRFKPTLKLITGKIYNLVNRLPSELNQFSVDERDSFAETLGSFNLNDITPESLFLLTDRLNKYRVEHKRIKRTPNNPVSSRTHLYIVLEINFESGIKGYITLIDMAGRENSVDIFNTFMDQSGRYPITLTDILGPTGAPGKIKLKPELSEYTESTVYDILKESFYINESINHLNYFFHIKNYQKYNIRFESENLDHYTTSKFYVDPRQEMTSILGDKNCLTIPIMQYLDHLNAVSSDQFKPTKFITLVCIRKDQAYCGQIFDSLEAFN